ncbi:MAG: nicotinate phosphoribosyltransferase [Trueperaceae bacterium]|nr:nicotinate phosphoribosyltransferase [Trueperaceae bacterium]
MKRSDRPTAEGFLFTDFYQLTMAQLYFKQGMHDTRAQFDYFFRDYPDYGEHKAGYCVSAGLEWLLDWMDEARVSDEDIDCLRAQTGRSGERIFSDDFLDWLRDNGHFGDITIRAIPEGRVVHPNVPVAVVEGPLAMAQILETSFLNHVNHQTLIATKGARIKEAARGGLVIDFGMRRGHEKGVNAGARGALIGGVDFSSNTGTSCVLGYPPKGTHAHSMVQAFIAQGRGEIEAFRAYAEVYPDDCLLLVDTVDTLASGVPNAITVFEELRERGHEPFGIRLDSGDLANLAIRSAQLLNDAGFTDAVIVLSNQLDEITIWQILTQIEDEAASYGVDPDALIGRLTYGVGTRLMVSKGDAALDGVYKLVALDEGGEWRPAIKLSETPEKTLTPGNKTVWRVYDRRGKATADLLGLDEDPAQADTITLHHPTEAGVSRTLGREEIGGLEPLLTPILENGQRVADPPDLDTLRDRRQRDVERLDAGVKRMMNPHIYHVSLTDKLWRYKRDLVETLREQTPD